jgi:hypothetical protein
MNRYDFALGKKQEIPPEDPSSCDEIIQNANNLEEAWNHYKPQTIREAVYFLKKLREKHLLFITKDFNALTENQFTGRAHHGLGQQIRNDWGLWQDSDLAKNFKEMGIHHADDMSGIILATTYREITGQTWDIAGQIKHYKDYWADMAVDTHNIDQDEPPDWQSP